MRSNVCLSGHPLAFGQFCRCILRTAIVPDEPIRAKGSEWGNFPLTLHLRRCPTSKLIPSVSRTFGAIFAPRLHLPRYSLVPRPPLTAVQLRSSITQLIESLFTLNVHPAGYPWPSASLAGVFRTAIVPDEPIRAKGAGWRNFSPTLHFRRHPTNPLVAPLLRIFKLGATFAPLPSLASLLSRSSASAIGGSVEGLDNPIFNPMSPSTLKRTGSRSRRLRQRAPWQASCASTVTLRCTPHLYTALKPPPSSSPLPSSTSQQLKAIVVT